ncbi:MAG: ATP-binding protein [Candidatus Bathyarchaeota archaeon]|nr:ATP-binding protein [Candidatus Bathyarchaeota archaeon]
MKGKQRTETENETTEEKFELTVESKLEKLPVISEFIEETMKQCKIQSIKDIYAVQLSVDEACTNIIKHAYSNKSEGTIVIRCMLPISGEKFIVNIMDWGKPFDPTTIPNPDTESDLNERKVGGLGIFFMRKFMDEVEYVRSNDMNLLIIGKYIKKNESSK